MQEIKLEMGECPHPPLNDDVSDDILSDFSYSDVEFEYDDIHAYHDSHISPKWDEKTIQAAGNLPRDPLDTRKTRSQFHNAFSTCDSNILERHLRWLDLILIHMKKHHMIQDGKQPCKKSSSLCKTMKLGSWFLYLSRKKIVQCKWC